MAGFDTRNALNLAIRHLSNAALERAAGGYIPPREAERQRKEQERLHIAQQRDMERQQKDQARQEEKARKEAERAAKDNGGSIGWSKNRLSKEIRTSHYEDGRSKSHVGYVNPMDFLHATTSNDDELRTIVKSAGDLNREKIEKETQSPFLIINNGKISGHEGRHRMAALAKAGYTSAPVAIHYRGNYGEFREPIDAMTFGPQYNDKRNSVTVSNMIPLHGDYADQINGMMEQHEDHFASGGQILSKQFPTQYMPNVGRQVMADGGMPDDMATAMPQMQPQAAPQMPQRRQFSIASQAEPVSEIPTEMPKSDTSNPTTMSLATAFDNAISHHLSLSRGDRILNSKEAINRLAPHVGMRKDNTLVPLLGKNEKLLKTETGYKGEEPVTWHDGRGIEAAGLALSPSFEVNKFNTCPNSASCKDECLGKTSGNYFKVGGGRDLSEFKGPRLNSLNKTLGMINEPEAFAVRLYDEIAAKKREAEMNGNILGVRLNVLSDINPRVHQSIIKAFPDVAFYDYTKMAYKPIADNHHYTYSSTGVSQPDVQNSNSNWNRMRRVLDTGENVAMAFTDKEHLPESIFDEETQKRYKVINGDTHDFRPLDRVADGEDGVIIGLKNKKGFGSESEAHKESGGFFVKYDPGRMKTAKGTYERHPSQGLGPSGKPKLGPTKVTNTEVKIMPQKKQQVPMTNDGMKEGEI
jgi:hypothetical protein